MNLKSASRILLSVGLLTVCSLAFASFTAAQPGMDPGNPGPNTPANMKVGKDKSPTNEANMLEMSNPHEETDFKRFQDVSVEKPQKKIDLGEYFLGKYNDSRYRAQVFSQLTVLYIQVGQPDKAFAAGASAVQLNPNDVRTMGVLSQSMARVVTPETPDATQKLDQAEKYGKQVLTVTPTLKKPDGLTDEAFSTSKNEALALAYSGLGLVYVRRAKYNDAIPDLQQAVQLDTKKDPTNYYLLGIANQNSSHFAEAAAAFSQCADLHGSLQATCKSNADEAKKRAASKPAATK
jgi:tetratricopeptide (TPR) repeat protein